MPAGDAPALTLVSAPAGFGKTTAVAEWVAETETVAWLSLEAADDEPVRFWTYVAAAVATAVPDLSHDAASLLQAPHADVEAAVTALINDLDATASDVTLVLDDYHVIAAPEIHDSLAFLLEHLPLHLRLVVATRADPPLPLAARRARGDLLEVRAADLRFTVDEATAYLNDAMGMALSTGDVEVLEARTEGWIAALQLAALSLRGRADPEAFISEFAGDDRFILDYLADEVLAHQSHEVRGFLLETSILDRLSGPLCATVTGRSDAGAILDRLDRANLFLVPLDDRRTWYRYHHLFADVLRARLLDEHPDRIPLLHRRASDWWSAQGEPRSAVAHAMAADDPTRAAEVIERAAPVLQRARQEAVLREWLEALPHDLFADRPVLANHLVGARMATGDPTGIEPLLAGAESWLDRDDRPIVADEREWARLPAGLAVHRAGQALLAGHVDAAIHHAGRVLALVEDDDPLPRGAATALLGLAHWSRGELDAACDLYVESLTCFVRGGHLPDLMGCSIALADIQLTLGRRHDARRTYESALALAGETPGLRGAADMHVGLGVLAVERNDLDAAADHLAASDELGDAMGLPQHAYRSRVAAARLHQAHGDLDAALALLTQAEPLYDTDFSPPVRPVSALRARIEVERGDVDAALRWAEERGLDPDDELSYVQELEHLTLARVLLARGTPDDIHRAIALLRRLLLAADDGHRAGSAIEVQVVLARALHAAGDATGAAAALADALTRAEPEGDVRTFLDEGPVVTGVLGQLTGAAGEQAARVLASRPSTAPRPPRRPGGPDALSDRELDVLRLLRSDLSGPDIARELHVSLNTLRTHTRHIYTKLGATNRREATTRAAELGL